ncbi:hypothetical protein FKM82_011858 [Ascaphus truei]
MENTELSLLSLIHQHLLHLGYYKAARELQLQSRKTFSSQSVSLQDIYTDWTQCQGSGKKRKARTANHDTAIKKPRVPDPVSSSETSEEEDKGKGGAAIAAKLIPAKGAPKLGSAENKKNAEKQAAKVKTASAAGKTMNSVTKAKNTPEMTSTPRQEKAAALHTRAPAAVMPESSETSDSDEEKTIPKTAPLPATLKPDLGLAESSDDTSSSDSEMDTVVQAPKAKGGKSEVAKSSPATPASGKLAQGKAASNGKVATPAKATVKPAANESSKTSDSADIAKTVKQKAPASQAKAAATATKVTTARTASQTKAAKIAASAKARAVTAAAPTSPQIGVTKGDVPGAVCTATAESSDTSGSEEDDDQMLIPTPKPAAPSPATAKVKVQTPASIAAAGSGSESSESESEEEPGGQHKAVAALVHAPPGTALSKSTWTTPFKMKTETLEAKVSTTTNPAEDDGSESSDSSDSEEEVPVAQVATPKKAATVKAPAAKAVAGRAVVPAPVVKKPELADDTESSASSDSEEEPTGQVKNAKVAPAQQSKVSTPASIPKNTATPTASQVKAAKGRVTTPAKAVVIKALPGSDSSDTIDSSDYDKSPYTKKLTVSMKATTKAQTSETAAQPVKAAKGKTNSPANAGVNIKAAAAAADESSDSSDSSDSEEEEPAAQKAAPAAQVAVKATPGKVSPKPAVTPTASSIGAAKSKATAPAVVKPTAADGSDSSDSSDSEEEPAAKMAAPAAQVAVKATPGKVSPKPAVTPTASSIGAAKSKVTAPAVVKPTAADSSDSSDSSDSEEEPAAKKAAPAAQVAVKATPGKMSPKPAVTPTASSIGAAKSKATAPAVVKPTAADSSDSSDSSDSEEEPAAKTGHPAPVLTKTQPGKLVVLIPNAILAAPSTKPQAKAPRGKVAVVKTIADVSESSDSSDSEEEAAAQLATPTLAPIKTKPGKMATKPGSTPSNAIKGKVAAPAKASIQDVSPAAGKLASSQTPVRKTGAGAAQNKLAALPIVANADSSSEDTSESELENSQLPLKQPVAAPSLPSMPSSRKRKRDKKIKDKQTSALGSAVRTKKKKRDSSTKTQTVTVAEIDSEEATMMALLAGSSPKREKPTKSASKKKKPVKLSVATAPILPVQNNNIPPKSGQLAQELYSVWEPECPNSAEKSDDDDDDVTTINKVKSPAPTTAPLLLPQSAEKRKKSSKKKNLSQEDAIARLKAKLAKNAKKAIKKEKKLKLAAGGVENMSPKTKSSKKDKKKSEKSDKKTKKKKKALKKDKKKEKRDKTAHPLSGGIEGQNDPAIGLSKPKKKKRIKAASAD